MRIFRVLTVLAGLFPVPALAAPLQWSDKTVVIGISVDSSGLVALAAFLTEIDGKLAVCGATWMDKDSATARPHRSKLLRALMVSADGRILPFSAQSFPVYLTAEEAQQGGPKMREDQEALG